jgi:hypothetical protein
MGDGQAFSQAAEKSMAGRFEGAHLQVRHWNLFIFCHHERASAREGSAFPTFSAAFKARSFPNL